MFQKNLNSRFYFAVCMASLLQISACVSTPSAPQNSQEMKPEPAQEAVSSYQEIESDNRFQLIENMPAQAEPIQGDLQYLHKGKESVFDIYGFRKLLEAEEMPSGIKLNFEGADIKEVIALVIGKIMNESYLIDPAVKGTVTLKTEKPLNKSTVFYMLENVLDLYGARISKRKGHYRIFPKNKPGMSILGFGDKDDKSKLGYGYRVIPLDFVSASEMIKILESVSENESIIRADEKRNLIILGGTSESVQNMLDAISMFDVDWMQGSNVGLININYASAQQIVEDLKKLLKTNHSDIENGGILTLDTIDRLNSILVITRQAKYLQRIQEWVRRLDIPTQGAGSRLYVYPVKNSTASELAGTLSELFGTDESAEADLANVDNNVTGPGSKPVKLSDLGKEEVRPVAETPAARRNNPLENNDIRIIAAEDTNTLLISATPAQYSKIELALGKLDTPPLQVLIEVSIMDVQLSDDFSYGMQWFFNHGDATRGGSGTIGDNVNFPQTFSYAAVRSGGDINAVLGLLASNGKVDVLSSPSVLVRNNRKASIRVGDQQPIGTAAVNDSGTIVATSVEYRDTGIILEIKPSISSSGTINVELTQEVIDVGDIDDATGQRTFLNRNLNTDVSVNNGETIILGGLIRTNSAITKSGVPWLRDLPVIGFLFGKTLTSEIRSELLIMLSPMIIRNQDESNQVINEYKSKFKFLDLERLQ